jgi:hypothetical protein
MTTIETTTTTVQSPEPEYFADEAQLAAAAFLARYSGRTLDAYRQDLRGFFQWTADVGLAVLEATAHTSSSTGLRSRSEDDSLAVELRGGLLMDHTVRQ